MSCCKAYAEIFHEALSYSMTGNTIDHNYEISWFSWDQRSVFLKKALVPGYV